MRGQGRHGGTRAVFAANDPVTRMSFPLRRRGSTKKEFRQHMCRVDIQEAGADLVLKEENAVMAL